MGFSGGGSNVLLPHTHDGRVSQDGGELDFNNITQANSSSGQMFYSNGTALQQLGIGTPAQVMTVSGGNLPSWSASGGGATLTRQTASSTTTQSTSSATPVDATSFTATLQAGAGMCICQYMTAYQTTNDMDLRWNFSTDGAQTIITYGSSLFRNATQVGITSTLSSQTVTLQFAAPFGGSVSLQRASYAGLMTLLEIS